MVHTQKTVSSSSELEPLFKGTDQMLIAKVQAINEADMAKKGYVCTSINDLAEGNTDSD